MDDPKQQAELDFNIFVKVNLGFLAKTNVVKILVIYSFAIIWADSNQGVTPPFKRRFIHCAYLYDNDDGECFRYVKNYECLEKLKKISKC